MARNQTNPTAFADSLIAAASGQRRRVLILGDSQWTVHTANRLGIGWRNRVDIPHFSWTGHAAPTGNDVLCGFNGNGVVSNATFANHAPDTATPYTGTNLFAPGSVPISIDRWSERQYNGVAIAEDAGPLFGFYASSGSASSVTGNNLFGSFRAGSWLSQDFKCRLITYYNNATQTTALNVYTYRAGSAKPKAIHNSTNWTPAGTSTGIKYQDFDVDGNTTDEPWLRVFTAAGVTEGDYASNAANSSSAALGCVFESKSRTGLGVTVLSNAGWSAEAHTLTTVCTDANLESYLNAVGIPDMVLFMCGDNLTTNEISGGVLQAQWKTNVSAVITRYNARLAALGKSSVPWLLVTPWYGEAAGGYADTVKDAQATAMHEIARDTSSGLVGHVNLSALCGSGASLLSAGYVGAADIHPQNAAACNFFVDRLLEGIFNAGAGRVRPPLKGIRRY